MEKKSYIYNNIYEYLFFLRKNDNNEKTPYETSYAVNVNRKFYGTKYDEIINLQHKRLMTKKDRIETISKINVGIESNYTSMRDNGIVSSVYSRDVVGDFFDVGDVLTGVPECWFDNQNNQNSGVLNIVTDITYPYTITHDAIMENGINLLSAIMALKSSNINYNFWLVSNVDYNGIIYQININATEIDNIDCLVTLLCSPSICRRLNFRALEIYTDSNFCYGYGVIQNCNFNLMPISNEDILYCQFGKNHSESIIDFMAGEKQKFDEKRNDKNCTVYRPKGHLYRYC